MNRPKRGFALWLGLCLLLAHGTAHAQLRAETDSWWGRDKQKHLTYSLALGAAASLLPVTDEQAIALALLPGFLKEAHDASIPERGASIKDLAWDAVGAYAGVKLGRVALRPRRDGLSVVYAATF